MAAEEMKPWSAADYLHGAVWPLLVADKVVGSEHHLADVTVKARFMPVLTEGKDDNLIVISHADSQRGETCSGSLSLVWSALYHWIQEQYNFYSCSLLFLWIKCESQIKVRCLNP